MRPSSTPVPFQSVARWYVVTMYILDMAEIALLVVRLGARLMHLENKYRSAYQNVTIGNIAGQNVMHMSQAGE